VADELARLQREALAVLEKALQGKYDEGGTDPFRNVRVALPLPPQLVRASDGLGQDSKLVALPHLLKRKAARGQCLVYAAGIASKPTFERFASEELACSVFGFDCTLPRGQPDWKFDFRPWCIGQARSFQGNVYAHNSASTSAYTFMSLSAIQAKLGHAGTPLTVLKLDIEGFEWDVLETELLAPGVPASNLPQQLLFELHTQGANPKYVPPAVVAGKTQRAVDSLFVRLFKLGYRVVNKEINNGDAQCAEFTLLRVE
jgi:hypothetical protein